MTYGWQPIETAPKDGTRVLLIVNGRVHLGYYVDTVHLEHGVETYRGQYWYWGDSLAFLGKKIEPTHWMAIPQFEGKSVMAAEIAQIADEVVAQSMERQDAFAGGR